MGLFDFLFLVCYNRGMKCTGRRYMGNRIRDLSDKSAFKIVNHKGGCKMMYPTGRP